MAILVLFVFLVARFITTETIEDDLQSDKERSERFNEKIQPVQSFITSCLDQQAKLGVELAAKQGGVIWDTTPVGSCSTGSEDQNGSVGAPAKSPEDHPLYPDLMCVKYVILADSDEDIPGAPWPTFPWNTSASTPNLIVKTSEVFGDVELNGLSGNASDTISSIIEDYIDNTIPLCLRGLSTFDNRFIVDESGGTETEVVFLENDVFFRMKYVVTLTDNATRESRTLKYHTVTLPIRFKKLYEITQFIVTKDTEIADFDIRTNLPGDLGVGGYDWATSAAGFYVKYLHSDFHYDIIAVGDNRSRDTEGEDFEFIFARENRKPALYYIENKDYVEIDRMSDFTISSAMLSTFFDYSSYRPLPDDQFIVPGKPDALDPDEDHTNAHPISGVNASLYYNVSADRCVNSAGDVANILLEPCIIPRVPDTRPEIINFTVYAYEPGAKYDFQGGQGMGLNITINWKWT
ncbi:hypothetical protein ACFLZX_01590 [Nanoarchaeota archaeon]